MIKFLKTSEQYVISGNGRPIRQTVNAGDISAVGQVYKTYHESLRVMSDMWDDVITVQYVTFDGIYGYNVRTVHYDPYSVEVTVDISEEVKTIIEAKALSLANFHSKYEYQKRVAEAANSVKVGDKVIVEVSRKYPEIVGKTMEVRWMGQSQWGTKVGLDDGSTLETGGQYAGKLKKWFVSYGNVKNVNSYKVDVEYNVMNELMCELYRIRDMEQLAYPKNY